MQACARCQYPIPAGEETWIRRKSDQSRVPICSQCAAALRQRKSQKTTPAAKNQSLPPKAIASTNKSGTIPIDGVLILTLMILVVAPIMGILYGVITNYAYLLILFPLGLGVLSGLVLHKGIRWGKIREPIVAGVFGLLFGLILLSSYRYTSYLMLRSEIKGYIMEDMLLEFGEADSDVANFILDEFLYEETGYRGFIGALVLEGREGMSISRVRDMDRSFNVGSSLTWLYWLFEAAAIIIIPFLMAGSETKRPFCETHDRWYNNEKSLGGISPENIKSTLPLLDNGQFGEFGRALDTKVAIPGLEIFIERCPNCQQSSSRLTIKKVRKGSRGRKDETVLAQQYITPAQSDELMQSIAVRTS